MRTDTTAICGGEVYTPWEHWHCGLVVIEEGKIASVGAMEEGRVPAGARRIEAAGKIVAPGFVDVHLHGGGGADFVRDGLAGLEKMSSFLASHGVTSFLPTTPSAPVEKLLERIAVARQAAKADLGGAQVLGIHLEGPYLARAQRGAHNPEFLRNPTIAEIDALTEAGAGAVKMITMAPELEGALEAIGRLSEKGVTVSVGHSTAGYAVAMEAIAAGANHGCHLFNCMPDLNKREPGIAGALLGEGRAFVELIADAVHIHPLMLRAAFKMKGAKRAVLISDAMEAAGMPDGEYELGGLQVSVKGGQARLADGTLAGSTLTLDRAVKNATELMGASLQEAIAMATRSAADSIGLARKGRLEAGADGDVVVLGRDLTPQATIVGGRPVFGA